MPQQPFHSALSDLPTETLLDGAFRRTAVVGDHVLVQATWLKPGHPTVPVDQHPYDQTIYVIRGTLELVLNGDQRFEVNGGEMFYIPGGVPHQAAAIGEDELHALDIFAPIPPAKLSMAAHQIERVADRPNDQVKGS
ncbi:cupin domain-containing protein [Mycolicibacterium stellerae]|uniref:cupin domain-containing protein n=1 Tax=Mycolicibacterium stellerae TaxID=2358193 RepID=UPI0013DE3744|nr:cupin domain-containing protein [Mycolicibacterium stellerae]